MDGGAMQDFHEAKLNSFAIDVYEVIFLYFGLSVNRPAFVDGGPDGI